MCRLSAGAAQCRQSAVEAGWRRHATLRHATPYHATTRRAAPRQGRADDRRRRAPSPLFFFHLPFPLAAGRVHAGRRATSSVTSKILAFHRPRGPPGVPRERLRNVTRVRGREKETERGAEKEGSPRWNPGSCGSRAKTYRRRGATLGLRYRCRFRLAKGR